MNYQFIRSQMLERQFARDQQRRLARRQTLAAATIPAFEEIVEAEFLIGVANEMKANGDYKAAGPDGVRFIDLSVSDLARIGRELHRSLLDSSWQPSTARLVQIPKTIGYRTLTIRSIATRIVATAVHRSLQPYWESIFLDSSYGFRCGRGVADMWLALERHMLQKNCSCIVQDDISKAFDCVINNRVVEDHARHIADRRLLDLIAKLLAGHPSEHRQIGIDQGSSVSPAALNLHLQHRLDLPLHAVGLPVPLRYADNLVVPAKTVSEGTETIGRARALLAAVGITLKGENPPADLRAGDRTEVLGIQIRAESGQLHYGLGQGAWQGLQELLEEALEMDNPVEGAEVAAQGWAAAYGPALAGARRHELAGRILSAAAGYGLTELSRQRVIRALQGSADRWRQLRARHGLPIGA